MRGDEKKRDRTRSRAWLGRRRGRQREGLMQGRAEESHSLASFQPARSVEAERSRRKLAGVRESGKREKQGNLEEGSIPVGVECILAQDHSRDRGKRLERGDSRS